MTCEHCAAAKTDPHWPGYQAKCRGCTVRAMATGPAFFEANRDQKITPAYRQALQKLLGDDWKAAHTEVRAEFDRLMDLKKGGKQP